MMMSFVVMLNWNFTDIFWFGPVPKLGFLIKSVDEASMNMLFCVHCCTRKQCMGLK